MLELNLLPKELRKVRKKKASSVQMPNIPIMPVLVGIVTVLIGVHFLLMFFAGNRKEELKVLKSRWKQMQPQREKTENVYNEIATLEKKVASIRKIAKPDLDWAKLLSGLNRAVIEGVWLSEFELKKGTKKSVNALDSLFVAGFALGKSESATAIVARFISSLKKSADFMVYFEDIELQNMKAHNVAGTGVMMFQLDCQFKPIESVSVEKTIQKKKRRT